MRIFVVDRPPKKLILRPPHMVGMRTDKRQIVIDNLFVPWQPTVEVLLCR